MSLPRNREPRRAHHNAEKTKQVVHAYLAHWSIKERVCTLPLVRIVQACPQIAPQLYSVAFGITLLACLTPKSASTADAGQCQHSAQLVKVRAGKRGGSENTLTLLGAAELRGETGRVSCVRRE